MRTTLTRCIAAALLPLFGLNACYTYRPVQSPFPEPGAEIRAQLSPPTSFPFGEFTIHDVVVVEGELNRVQGDSLAVWGRWLHTLVGSKYALDGGLVYVLRPEVVSVEQRRLAPGPTALTLLGVTALTALAFALVQRGGGGEEPGGGPPGPIDVSVRGR